MTDPAAVARGLAALLHLDARRLAARVPRAPALRVGRAPPAARGGRGGGRPQVARRAPLGRDAARVHARRRPPARSSAAPISTTAAWTGSSCSSTASCAAGPAGPRCSASGRSRTVGLPRGLRRAPDGRPQRGADARRRPAGHRRAPPGARGGHAARGARLRALPRSAHRRDPGLGLRPASAARQGAQLDLHRPVRAGLHLQGRGRGHRARGGPGAARPVLRGVGDRRVPGGARRRLPRLARGAAASRFRDAVQLLEQHRHGQARHARSARAALPLRHRPRLRQPHRAGLPGRDRRPAAQPRPLVGALVPDHRDRARGLGDAAAAGAGLRRDRQRRRAHGADAGARGARRRGRRAAPLRAARLAPRLQRSHHGHAARDADRGGGQRHGEGRAHPGLRARRQDRHRAEVRPRDPHLRRGQVPLLVRGLRPGGRAHAGRASW